ncbi:MAG: hypothetical protein ACJAT1_001003 [Marivirga sp.]|jgi:hypothetical protein
MQTINLRRKLHLYGYQIIVLSLILLLPLSSFSQTYEKENLPNFDNQLIHYGFYIGGHTASMKLKYNENFLTSDFDSLHSVIPQSSPGFTVGFIFNLRLAQYLDFRALPGVGLYQYTLNYNIYDNAQTFLVQGKKESFYIEFPILLKYKSQRRGNFRAYIVGGVKPSYEVSGKRPNEINEDILLINTFNAALEIGLGVDIYYEFFKFSPEIRFSRGINNALFKTDNSYSRPIEQLTTNAISLYLQFQ